MELRDSVILRRVDFHLVVALDNSSDLLVEPSEEYRVPDGHETLAGNVPDPQ